MKYVLWPGYAALMWCGLLITRPGYKISKTTETHENIHLQQAKVLGGWWIFYIKYLFQYLGNLLVTFSPKASYYCLDVEKEAYSNERNPNYIVTKESIKKYRTPLFLRHKEWKTYKNAWRAHCESIGK